MPKRTVKVKLSYDVVIDDDREGIPWVPEGDLVGLALNGCKSFRGLTEIKNVRVDMGLDRESAHEARRRARVVRMNQR